MKKILFPLVIGLLLLSSCQSKPDKVKKVVPFVQKETKKETPLKTEASLKQILLKPEVPILCYHRIRNILASDGPNMKTYSVTPADFAQQMKALADNGYHTILPAQLNEYLIHNGKLPSGCMNVSG